MIDLDFIARIRLLHDIARLSAMRSPVFCCFRWRNQFALFRNVPAVPVSHTDIVFSFGTDITENQTFAVSLDIMSDFFADHAAGIAMQCRCNMQILLTFSLGNAGSIFRFVLRFEM